MLQSRIIFFTCSSLSGSNVLQLATYSGQAVVDGVACDEYTLKNYGTIDSLTREGRILMTNHQFTCCSVRCRRHQRARGPERDGAGVLL